MTKTATSNLKLYAVIFSLFAFLSFMLWRTAALHGMWKAFWVSEFHLALTAVILAIVLRRRDSQASKE